MRTNTMMGGRFRRGTGLLLVLAGAVFFCGALFADEEIIHVMKRGETIYGLSREYGVDIEEILFLNGIEDARKVQSGQHIRIRVVSAKAPPINDDPNAPPVKLYRVQKGETLFGLSQKFRVSLQELSLVNNLPENYVLKAGDTLKIPVEPENMAGTVNTTKTQPVNGLPQPEFAEPDGAAHPNTAPPIYPREVNLSLIWPINPKEAAYMTGKLSGVAMVGKQGEGVYSIFPGTVISAGPYRGFGRVVIVKSAEGYLYVYGGCEALLVKAGDTVATGMELGRLGIDAVSGQAALFFMVYLNNIPVDPATAPRE